MGQGSEPSGESEFVGMGMATDPRVKNAVSVPWKVLYKVLYKCSVTVAIVITYRLSKSC